MPSLSAFFPASPAVPPAVRWLATCAGGLMVVQGLCSRVWYSQTLALRAFSIYVLLYVPQRHLSAHDYAIRISPTRPSLPSTNRRCAQSDASVAFYPSSIASLLTVLSALTQRSSSACPLYPYFQRFWPEGVSSRTLNASRILRLASCVCTLFGLAQEARVHRNRTAQQ